MEKILYFDYSAIIILIMLLESLLLRKMTKGKQNMYMLLLVSVATLVTMADIWAVQLDNMGTGHLLGKYVSHSLYLLLHNVTIPIYILYLISLTDTWHKMRNGRGFRILLYTPIYVICVLLVVNFFVPIMFYFDANDAYTRGPMFLALYVSSAIYVLMGIGYLIRYRRTLSKSRFLSLILLFPLVIGATVVQFLFPQFLIELFVQAIAILLIFLVIQRPEERVDYATGCGNLKAYAEDMRRSFKNKKPVQLIMVNIINYEAIRDVLGYRGTQEVLKQVTASLIGLEKQQKLPVDIYHLGGGSFRLAFEEKHFPNVEEIANQINEMMKQHFNLRGMDVKLMACVCIVSCQDDVTDLDGLFAFGKALDSEAYKGVVLHANELIKNGQFDIKRDIDRILEKALVNHKFEVYYQPIYSVRTGQFRSAEALLRLKDDTYGFVSPEIFIPAAERNGTIHKIGEYVLEEVCRFIASSEFKELGMEYIEVNLSVAQCMERGFAKKIIELIEKYQISTRTINLEITETAYSYSQHIMMENIEQLTKAGIRFSLDDYGTGYSNMQRIAQMPFDLIKLDKTFTSVEDNTKMRIVVENTIQMIKNMGMETVVEGVETEDMVKTFSGLQCEYIQGYYFSKPIPRPELVQFLKQARA